MNEVQVILIMINLGEKHIKQYKYRNEVVSKVICINFGDSGVKF